MNIELPQTRPYGALFAVGSRLSGGEVQEIGSIIVKAGYLLTSSGGADSHVMTPDPDAAASALVLADQGAPFADPADGMDVTREADLAPFKPLADIVVEGFRSGLDIAGAELRVNGTLWLTRVEDINNDGVLDATDVAGLEAPSLADRNRHLFGYQPRSESPRQGDAKADPTDKPVSLLDFDNYSNRFLNFHRRGGGFTSSAAIADALTTGERITLRKAGADALSVTLALPPLTALYRTWCGRGPDKPPYWTRIRLGAMRADTLILRPDAGRAEVIWRAIWPWADEPTDRYRAIRVSEEHP
jgi:hypothetical protein